MVTLAAMHTGLREIDPQPLSRRELYGLISNLERLRSRVDERLMAAKATLDSLGDAGADSAVVGRSVGRRSERQAKRDRVTARGLADMPTLAESLAEGRLNVEHAAIVAAAAEEVTPEVAAALVPLAESVPADLLAKKAREFVGRHTSATEAEDRHARQCERRAAWSTTNGDGSVEIHGRFDKAAGERVLAAWRRRADRLWHDGGRDGTPNDVRTHAQRNADALAQLICEETTAGTAVHPKHQVHLTWNLDEPQATWLDGSPVPDPVLAELGPTADVIGHVFDDTGQVLWQGRRRRLASPAQWRTLIVQTRGCAHCGATIDRCQAHHLRQWIDGGVTNPPNLQLLCHTCHGIEHRRSGGEHRQHRRIRPFRAATDQPDDHTLSA